MSIADAGNRDEVLDEEPSISPHAASCPAFTEGAAVEGAGSSVRGGGACDTAKGGACVGRGTEVLAESLPNSALQRILDFGRSALHAREAALVLARNGVEQPRCLVSSADDEEVEWVGDVCSGRGALATLGAGGHVIRLPDQRGASRSDTPPARHPRARSLLGAPIGTSGGIFFAEKEGGRDFTEEDERLALFLAEQAAAAVEGAHLLTQARARIHGEVQTQRLSAISTLASVVGHELRNPLSVINNAIFFLGTKVASGDPRVGRHLDIIKHEIRKATRIIEDLLDFSRDRPPQPVPVPLRMLLRDALARQVTREHVRVEEDLPGDLPLICVDPAQMRQALASLLANAVEAMPGGGTLRLRASAADGRVIVRIEDTGCGIPPEDLGRVFEPLFTTKPHGIGLGLALVRRVMDAHHGNIRIESEEGKGTTATLTLPAVRPGPTP